MQTRYHDGSRRYERPRYNKRVHFPDGQQGSDGPRNRPLSLAIPPEFFNVTREQFAIIKSVHHRHQLANGLPPSLTKKMAILRDSVKPAFNNELFKAHLEEISKNWGASVHRSLRRHYDDVISEALDTISNAAMPEEVMRVSISLITKWARRQLKEKLKDEVLDEALSLIGAHQKIAASSATTEATSWEWIPPSPPTMQGARTSTFTDLKDAGSQTEAADASSSCGGSSCTRPVGVDLQSELSRDEVTVPVGDRRVLDPQCSKDPVECSSSSAATECDYGSQVDKANGEDKVLSQLDLFGSVVSDHCGKSRLSSAFNSIEFDKSVIMFGDSNIRDFRREHISVISLNYGRLSFFKQLAVKCAEVEHQDVKSFFFCLSLLDKGNLPSTNFSCFRSMMHNLRNAFPQSKLYVLLLCNTTDCTPAEKKNIDELNLLIRSRSPANCTVINPPTCFCANNNVWDQKTKDKVFEVLESFL